MQDLIYQTPRRISWTDSHFLGQILMINHQEYYTTDSEKNIPAKLWSFLYNAKDIMAAFGNSIA